MGKKRVGIVIGNASVTSCLGINPHALDILRITEYECPWAPVPPEPPANNGWATESGDRWLTESGDNWILE